MAKPILFTTISEAKYNALSDEDKLKKNWIVKKEDGTTNTAISNLEGGSLPEVTSEDKGKVLSVDENGDWIAAEASGSNDFLVTYTSNDGETFTADKTYAEIQAAIGAGQNVKGTLDIYNMFLIRFDGGSFSFMSFDYTDEGFSIIIINHHNDNVINFKIKTIAVTP